jgi:hypothetical protein
VQFCAGDQAHPLLSLSYMRSDPKIERAMETDRRAHSRIASANLPDARIRIPSRPPVALVDLSAGGALIELPFPVVPQSRLLVELHTSIEQVVVRFQLLRCYVAKLEGGVRYHAAGAFDQLLTLPSISAAPSARERVIGTLERLQRAGQEAGRARRAPFHDLLALVVNGLRRGESVALVTLKLKARLTQRYPSLVIAPSLPFFRATVTSAEFFGLTFTSKDALSADDRRLLRSSAQLLSMLESCEREAPVEPENAGEQEPAPLVVHSSAEWMLSKSPTVPAPH